MKQISQSQILDYQVCPWRYYLKNVRNLSWPEPITPRYQELARASRLGKSFHQFVHRYIQGMTFAELAKQDYEPEMLNWIQNFRKSNPLPAEARLTSEIELAATFENVLWIGFVDAIALLPDQALIFDWKTSKKPGAPAELQKSPQTRLYRFLLYHARQDFLPDTGQSLKPEAITMVYWYPNWPSAPVRLPYSDQLFRQDQDYFRQIALDLSQEDPSFFPQTPDEDVCRSCRFQTFCRRGIQPQAASADEPDWNPDTAYAQDAFDFMDDEPMDSDGAESVLGPGI